MALLTPRLQAARYGRIQPHIKGRVLDLGCHRALIYEQHGADLDAYCGVDYDEAIIAENRERFPEVRFEVRHLDDDDLDLGETFDTVLMVALIEHLFNQKHVLTQVKEALAPGGTVVITSPTPIGNDVVHATGSRLGLFAKDATDDHVIVFNRRRLAILADEVGLRLAEHEYFQLRCNQLALLRHA